MKTSFNNFFKDKNGNFVIFQKPNFLIILAICFFVLGKTSSAFLMHIGIWGFRITIVIWSLDELFRGDSKFRQLLGAIVGILILLTVLN